MERQLLLICQSQLHPNLSAYAHIYNHHDYNRHLFIPIGMEALVHAQQGGDGGGGGNNNGAAPSNSGGGPGGMNNTDGLFGIATDRDGGGKVRVNVTTMLALPAQ